MATLVKISIRDGISTAMVNFDESFPVQIGDMVIIAVDEREDYGQVAGFAQDFIEEEGAERIDRIVRVATEEDIKNIDQNRKKAKNALKTCEKKIEEHQLEMKLVVAEFSFDKKKVIFYFTAEERIDFRDLVKDLAKIFKMRIEMRQIGVRDEAKMYEGVGPCGRALCCVKFLKNFKPVTIKMAKVQNLPLNPTKISGVCGRLMCCLSYEYTQYQEWAKQLPREGEMIRTPKGKGRIIEVNLYKKEILVKIEDSIVKFTWEQLNST